MKNQILNLLISTGRKMTTEEISVSVGSINRVVYAYLKQLGKQLKVRMIERENGDLKSCNTWYSL